MLTSFEAFWECLFMRLRTAESICPPRHQELETTDPLCTPLPGKIAEAIFLLENSDLAC
jgi:hypothetical protein